MHNCEFQIYDCKLRTRCLAEEADKKCLKHWGTSTAISRRMTRGSEKGEKRWKPQKPIRSVFVVARRSFLVKRLRGRMGCGTMRGRIFLPVNIGRKKTGGASPPPPIRGRTADTRIVAVMAMCGTPNRDRTKKERR